MSYSNDAKDVPPVHIEQAEQLFIPDNWYDITRPRKMPRTASRRAASSSEKTGVSKCSEQTVPSMTQSSIEIHKSICAAATETSNVIVDHNIVDTTVYDEIESNIEQCSRKANHAADEDTVLIIDHIIQQIPYHVSA